MLAINAHLMAVDFESTGTVSGYPDEPWQIGLVPIVAGQPAFDQAHECYLRVAKDRPFNPCAPGSWHLVRDQLADARTLPDLLPTLSAYIMGRTLVAHHASTEKKFFRKAWPLHRPGPWIDTLKLARMAYPTLMSFELEAIMTELGLTAELKRRWPTRSAHDALYDAGASALLLCHLLQQGKWSGLTVDDLTRTRAGR